MRATIILLGVLAVPGVVRAEDVVGLGAAVGAGGQGTATYGAVGVAMARRTRSQKHSTV